MGWRRVEKQEKVELLKSCQELVGGRWTTSTF